MKNTNRPGNHIYIFAALMAVTLFADLPIMRPMMPNGHDIIYHLGRIEALKQGLMDHQFPVRVSGYWLHGYGYASSIYYSDLFLLLPALLRIAGVSLSVSYKIYVIFINLITTLISYYSFRMITKSRYAGAIGCLLYTLASYRLECVFIRASVGEYTAMAFYPLVAAGLWQIYSPDVDSTEPGSLSGKEGHSGKATGLSAKLPHIRQEWLAVLPAVLGYSGIIESHVLSVVMISMATVLVILCTIRKTFTRRTISRYFRMSCGVIALNAWYLIPFIQSYSAGVRGSVLSFGTYSSRGAHLWQLLNPFPVADGGSIAIIRESRELMEMPYAVGCGLILAAAIGLKFNFDQSYAGSRMKRCTRIALLTAALAMLMSTYLFPWDELQKTSDLFRCVISNIQFPWRFIGIATIACTICGVLSLQDTVHRRQYASLMVAGSLITASYFLTTFGDLHEYRHVNENPGGYTDSLLGAEYLPSGIEYFTDLETLNQYIEEDQAGTRSIIFTNFRNRYSDIDINEEYLKAGAGINLQSYGRRNGQYFLDCSNSAEDSYIVIPYIFYQGYTARSIQTHENLKVSCSDHYLVKVEVPAGFEGTIRVRFADRPLWKMGNILSLTALVMIIMLVRRSMVSLKERANEKQKTTL